MSPKAFHYDDVTVIADQVVKINKITLTLPIAEVISPLGIETDTLEIKTDNRELIHIAIHHNYLLDLYLGKPDYIYERIFKILIQSKEISFKHKCLFDCWNIRSVTFTDCETEICDFKKRQEFFYYNEKRIMERFNGFTGGVLRDYLNLVNNSSFTYKLTNIKTKGK